MTTQMPSLVRRLRLQLEGRIAELQEALDMTQGQLSRLQEVGCPHAHMKQTSPYAHNEGDLCEDCGKVWTQDEIDNFN